MPSTGDEAPVKALSGLEKIYERQRAKLSAEQEKSLWFSAAPHVVLWNQLRLLMQHLRQHPGPDDARLLDRITPQLLREKLIPAPFRPDARLSELLEQLAAAELILLDRIARSAPSLQRNYLKQIHRIMANALSFNTTSDTVRIEPILRWIQTVVPPNPAAAYADVGCSMDTGAQNTLLAAQLLRPHHCGPLHGVDILPPAPELQRTMLRQHRILLYQADTLSRPLPRRYDLLLLANVHRHLAREDQEHLLAHLGESLVEGGHLFINWRFNAGQSPCLALRRYGHRLDLVAEHNGI